jgi:hypothetical protein
MKAVMPLLFAAALMPAMAFSQVIVNDSWTDGGRNNGADPQDTDWWTSTSSQAIEVSTGSLGLVSGTSGRGIHGTFAAQALGIGDTLTATFMFTTPNTVVASPGSQAAFRIGWFDTTGKPGLAADLSASSGSPNAIYNNLAGYMMDYDVNFASANIQFRERTNGASGQLMAATADFANLQSGGTVYSFTANTAYKGVFSVKRTGADSLDLTGQLYQGASLLSSFTGSDSTGIASTFGMLAFHVNSGVFGSSATPNAADNGIDFSNITIEYSAVPEPASAALLGLAGLMACFRRRR